MRVTTTDVVAAFALLFMILLFMAVAGGLES